jgi:hypothetical protein
MFSLILFFYVNTYFVHYHSKFTKQLKDPPRGKHALDLPTVLHGKQIALCGP